MRDLRCRINYHNYGIAVVPVFAGGVKTGVYTNTTEFPTPPITETQLNTLINNYNATYEEYKNGGKLKKPFFTEAKKALMNGLDDIANYINGLSGLTPEIIEKGGYVPTKTVITGGNAPDTPQGAILSRGISGRLFAEVPKVNEAENYGCIVFVGSPLEADSVTFTNGQLIATEGPHPTPMPSPASNVAVIIDVTKGRKKQFINLQRGTEYFFYFYAANANGVSGLSEVRSIICG